MKKWNNRKKGRKWKKEKNGKNKEKKWMIERKSHI